MRASMLVVLVLGSLSGPVLAQAIPDSVPAYRYFPISVGNEWQYVFEEPPAEDEYVKWVIVGDSLIEDRQYFRWVATHFDASLAVRVTSKSSIRFDSTKGEVVQYARFPGGQTP
ncbi:MAG: hypothetical protein WBW88_16210 [Rhodothermales bacterium]